MIFIGKISKRHNSVKNVGHHHHHHPSSCVGDVTVIFLCTLSNGGLYLYKVS